METTTLNLGPPLGPIWSINQERRWHWRQRADAAKLWREGTCWLAKMQRGTALGPSLVFVRLPFKDKRRRDPSNYLPVVKAIVDGLVDAGWWPDDGPEWVTVYEPMLFKGEEVTVWINPR